MRIEQVWASIGVTMVACAATASAQCTYSVQSTPNWPCVIEFHRIYTGTGLNNLGAWCGYRGMCYPEEGEGYFPIYCPPNGTPQVLPMPPNAGPKGAQATAVNDAGVVVGFSFQGLNGSEEIGCIWWPDGTITEIPFEPGATISLPKAINNNNVVVGVGAGAFVLKDGVLISILPPPGLESAAVNALSDSGFVVGAFGNTNLNGRGFRWRDGELVLLDPLPGFPASVARDVDEAGNVVGYSRIAIPPATILHAPTYWGPDKRPVALAFLPGYTGGSAFVLGDDGLIAGSLAAAGGALPTVTVVWIEGVPLNINGLTVPRSAAVGGVVAANTMGQLLFGGGAKLLTPIGQSFADVNADCTVDGADIAKLLAEWGPREWSIADINGDGVVNGFDLGLLLGEWTPAATR